MLHAPRSTLLPGLALSSAARELPARLSQFKRLIFCLREEPSDQTCNFFNYPLDEKIAGFDGNERLPKGGAEFCESLEREGLAIPAFILALDAALSHATMGQVVAFHLILILVAVVAVHEETLYGVQSRHDLRCKVIWCWALLSVKTMEEGKAEEERLEREGEV